LFKKLWLHTNGKGFEYELSVGCGGNRFVVVEVSPKERFMSEGKVKWFNTRKGYGFICTSNGTDIFVHYSNISGDGYRTLEEDDPVSFDIVEGDKGLRAENVALQSAPKSKVTSESKASPETETASESESE
jgi:CspA family cold shock protein